MARARTVFFGSGAFAVPILEAVAAAAELSLEAVVTDVQMPNMTGFELTKAIKADPQLQKIPVVIVTSLALLVMVLGIVKWTNNKFAGHEGAKADAKVEAAH